MEATSTNVDPADKSAEAAANAGAKHKAVEREILETHALPGGRNNPIHSTIPGLDSDSAAGKAMAQHSADFIAAQVKGNRAGMEAARSAFHAVRAGNRGRVPHGIEAPCTGSGCVKMAAEKSTSCGRADCGTSLDKNVSRPRG